MNNIVLTYFHLKMICYVCIIILKTVHLYKIVFKVLSTFNFCCGPLREGIAPKIILLYDDIFW